MNQSYARVNAPYANHAHAPEMCLEYNCTKVMHSRYFRVHYFWSTIVQK